LLAARRNGFGVTGAPGGDDGGVVEGVGPPAPLAATNLDLVAHGVRLPGRRRGGAYVSSRSSSGAWDSRNANTSESSTPGKLPCGSGLSTWACIFALGQE